MDSAKNQEKLDYLYNRQLLKDYAKIFDYKCTGDYNTIIRNSECDKLSIAMGELTAKTYIEYNQNLSDKL